MECLVNNSRSGGGNCLERREEEKKKRGNSIFSSRLLECNLSFLALTLSYQNERKDVENFS